VIGSVLRGVEENTRSAIAAAKHALGSFDDATKEARANSLRQLHEEYIGA
jgi:hypothetical protein